jgi:hypothetical protein
MEPIPREADIVWLDPEILEKADRLESAKIPELFQLFLGCKTALSLPLKYARLYNKSVDARIRGSIYSRKNMRLILCKRIKPNEDTNAKKIEITFDQITIEGGRV